MLDQLYPYCVDATLDYSVDELSTSIATFIAIL